jgi:hypothetical protein
MNFSIIKKRGYKVLVIVLLLFQMWLFSQSAQFVVEYGTFKKDAYLSDAVIAAAYLLKDTTDNLTLNDALTIFKDNKIDLKFRFCKKQDIVKCLSNKKLDRLYLAYVFFKALKLKGGITTMLFGVTPKYAYRELLYLNFFRGGFSGQYVTRIEVLNMLSAALEYKKKLGVKK